MKVSVGNSGEEILTPPHPCGTLETEDHVGRFELLLAGLLTAVMALQSSSPWKCLKGIFIRSVQNVFNPHHHGGSSTAG